MPSRPPIAPDDPAIPTRPAETPAPSWPDELPAPDAPEYAAPPPDRDVPDAAPVEQPAPQDGGPNTRA